MAGSQASAGSPILFAHVLQTAREAGMEVSFLRALRGDEAWRERCRIWEGIMRSVRISGFPIRVAQRCSVGEIGPLGMAAEVASDLRGAFQRMLHHHYAFVGRPLARVRGDVSSETTVLEVLPIEGGDLGARCRRELFVASGLKFARDVSGQWVRPRRVCFRHAAPRDSCEHEAFFDCEIQFDADHDGVEFDHDTLSTPLPRADADLSQFLGEHLRAVAGDPPATTASPEGSVLQLIRERLGNRTLAMGPLAGELGMSARTLRRRLLEHGTSYHDILDRVRRERADDLLEDPDHKLSEIAFLLGFSDASAFHRAYVRWTGTTPSSRRDARPRFNA